MLERDEREGERRALSLIYVHAVGGQQVGKRLTPFSSLGCH